MKKIKMFLLGVSVFAMSSTFAQRDAGPGRPTLSIGLEAGVPMGDFADVSKLGIGGSLKAAFPVASDADITLSAGYMTFSGKTVSFGGTSFKYPNINLIPIKAGFRYKFGGGAYFEPQLGYTNASAKGAGSSSGAFTYAANLGYFFSPTLDLGVRYEAFSKNSATTSFVGARLAYSFSL